MSAGEESEVPRMELLVYVRNYGGRERGSTYVGASIGASVAVEHPEARGELTSMAEFRVAAEVDDPVEALRDAVEQVFALLGSAPHHRTIYYASRCSALRVRLEPGFDAPHQIEAELAEMLALCSPRVYASAKRPRLVAVPVQP